MTYRIETSLSPALYDWRTIKEHHTTVAIDILRASTAICAAFRVGVQEIVPLNSLEQLKGFREKGYLLAAERNGEKIDNAECGNSPTEYLSKELTCKRLAYSTTNGTVCVLRAADADRTLVGCFSNISVLAEKLITEPQDVVLLCSGWKNGISLEDTLFAGALSSQLIASETYTSIDDATTMAINLWNEAAQNAYEYCQKATHVQRLLRLNYEKDIRYAFVPDTCNIVPILNDKGVLTR